MGSTSHWATMRHGWAPWRHGRAILVVTAMDEVTAEENDAMVKLPAKKLWAKPQSPMFFIRIVVKTMFIGDEIP